MALVPVATAVAAAVPAAATTYTPDGLRCTVVGTSGADVLSGTAGRDVICALGGDDLVRARAGSDIVVGGGGSDELYGGDGGDDLSGGTGGDHIEAGTGSDDVAGESGRDDIEGGGGDDEIRGGDDGDQISGQAGEDELFGQEGNDDLVGGRGADHVAGGDGTNWCTLDSLDTSTRCKYDRQPPSVRTLELSPRSVDVTDGDKYATVRLHVVDDTGVSDVQLTVYDVETGAALQVSSSATLVSGSVRDGWWEDTFLIRRWTEPGSYSVLADLRDRVRRNSTHEVRDALEVANSTPDRDLPTVVQLIRPTVSTVVDVRTDARTVVIEARIQDTLSGVSDGNSFCLYKPVDGGYTNLPCPTAVLVSGTRYDGVWRARIQIPRGETGGDWNVGIDARDRAHLHETRMWLGPDLWSYWTDGGSNPDPHLAELPDGAGRFSVLGTTDSAAPRVTGVTISPSRIDTLPGPVKVDFEVTATDVPGEGVDAVGISIHGAENDRTGVDFEFLDLALTGGTDVDGTWTGSYWVPQGTPPGTYYLQVVVSDPTHYRSYFSPGSPYASDPGAQLLTEPAELVVEENPAG